MCEKYIHTMHTQTAEFTDIEYYRGQENTVMKNELH